MLPATFASDFPPRETVGVELGSPSRIQASAPREAWASKTSLSAQAADVSDRLHAVVSDLEKTVSQLRSTVYQLGLIGNELGIRAQIISLLRDPNFIVCFEVHRSFDGAVDTAITAVIAEHLLATVREAVTDIGRHAQATRGNVRLSVDGTHCQLGVDVAGSPRGGETPPRCPLPIPRPPCPFVPSSGSAAKRGTQRRSGYTDIPPAALQKWLANGGSQGHRTSQQAS